jgi:hypothetical protein
MWDTEGVGDYFVYCMAGIEPFQRATGQEFQFPIPWLLFWGCIFLGTLSYPRRDLTSYGQQILIRMDRRTSWWISKCIWITVNSILTLLVYALVILLFALASGIPLLFENQPELTLSLFTNYYELAPTLSLSTIQVIGLTLLLPLAFLISVALLQLLLSLIIPPMFAFFLTLSVLIVSAFVNSPFLIGNYAMVLRSSCLIVDGVVFAHGLLIFSTRKLQVQVGHLVVDSIGFKPLVTDSAEGNICDQGCRSRQAA